MTVPVWITPISMVVYTVLLMLLTEFMRRHYRTSMWVWVVSLATIPLWIINIPGDDWFRWAKNLSVILGNSEAHCSVKWLGTTKRDFWHSPSRLASMADAAIS